ncbi:hypothetical protein P22_2052 [Propionispora sp. 2/2-37]|uniref:thiamine diphosphokinase n=1 Tax=Propionispora sp. 2/2-37 TaxID=1677858 RepID=UPI0006BB67BE|nr:thiamine diphosphokinase [Propionispora sp. 2/2-37]CUH95964.1 hypothetical protein P22_2052 [Propionispora sp. 2/2-37]
MNNSLVLPHLRCSFAKELPETQVLLVAGGRPPAKEWLLQAASRFSVWCADRGLDVCRESNVIPERLIGDGDSARSEAIEWARKQGIPADLYPPEKDLTDLQLALQTIGAEYKQAAVVITGVWGGRFDHTFSNIFSLKGCDVYGIQRCCAVDETEALILLKGADSLRLAAAVRPDVISLLPLSAECSGVTIDGVRWPLNNVSLQHDFPYAISNRPLDHAAEITVSVAGGVLGVYLHWQQNSLP